MNRNPNIIIDEIKKLITELEASVGVRMPVSKKKAYHREAAQVVPKGALGAITMLIEEGFFDSPKEISAIIEKLKEVGHYHKIPTVGMNLLNLTKRRILNRFKNKETKNWEYVIRK